MPDPELITSTANRRVVAARKLRLRKHRREAGRFLLEGIQALHMALDAGLIPVEIFYVPAYLTTPGAAALLDRLRATAAPRLPVAPSVMATLSERDEPQGVIAILPSPITTLAEITLPDAALVLVLDRLQDPGNLGTLIRTADAVGAAGVVLLTPAADPYDPKALRSSMGSVFNLPIAVVDRPAALFTWLSEWEVRPVAADAHAGARWGDDALWQGRVALILGNEARGLSPDIAPQVRRHVHLPVRGKADSLNVATAGGVLMYLWLRAHEAVGDP